MDMDTRLLCRLCLKMQSEFDLIEIFSENGQLKQLSMKICEVFRIKVSFNYCEDPLTT